MSQNAARHDPHAKSREEDVPDTQARQPAHKQGAWPRQPVGQPPAMAAPVRTSRTRASSS